MRVLAVCLGNICRSPLAEVLLHRALRDHGIDAEVDSAGTGDWHVGNPPDPRSCATALEHGIQLTHRARQLTRRDFTNFDWILVMDAQNLQDARRLAPAGSAARVHAIREFDPSGPGDVPDPYYGGEEGFQEVWVMLERAAEGFARHLREQQQAP